MTTPAETFDRGNHSQSNLSAKVTRALMEKGANRGIEHWRNFRHKDLGALVSTYPHDILRKIDEFVTATEKQPNSFRVNVIKLHVLEEATAERINEVIHFLPLFDHTRANSARTTLASLHQYQQLPRSNDYSREAPIIIAQCTALLHIAFSLNYLCDPEGLGLERDAFFNSDWTIANEQLVELALTHPEHAQRIRDFIIQRENVNVDVIKTMLANETTALNNGIL